MSEMVCTNCGREKKWHTAFNEFCLDENRVLQATTRWSPPSPVEPAVAAQPEPEREFVRKIFPEAYLYDTKRGGFDIVDCIDKDRAMSIGYGKTENAAWNDAARRQGYEPAAQPVGEPEKIEHELGFSRFERIQDEVKSGLAIDNEDAKWLLEHADVEPKPAPQATPDASKLPPRPTREHIKQFATTLFSFSYIQYSEFKRWADEMQACYERQIAEMEKRPSAACHEEVRSSREWWKSRADRFEKQIADVGEALGCSGSTNVVYTAKTCYDLWWKRIEEVKQLTAQIETMQAEYATNFAAAENRWHEAEAKLVESRDTNRELNRRNQELQKELRAESGAKRFYRYYQAALTCFRDEANRREEAEARVKDLGEDLSKMTNVARMLREELNATQQQRDELERRIAYALL